MTKVTLLAKRPSRNVILAALGVLLVVFAVGVGVWLAPSLADLFRGGEPLSVTAVEESPQLTTVAGERLDSPSARQAIETTMLPGQPPNVHVFKVFDSVKLALRGERSEPVQVLNIRVRVLKEQSALSGTLFIGNLGWEGNEKIGLSVAIDDPAPVLTESSQSPPYFSLNHISLDRGETKTIELYAGANRCACEWDLAIDYQANGRNGIVYVGRGGVVRDSKDDSPFLITAMLPRLEDYGAVYAIDISETNWHYHLVTPDRYQRCMSYLHRDSIFATAGNPLQTSFGAFGC